MSAATVHALKEPEKVREVDGAAPAVVIKAARQIGTQLMEMQFAVPLDMTLADLNAYVDKVTSVMDRQGDKAALEQEELALKGAERDLRVHQDQLANRMRQDETDWTIGNRRGEFKPTEAQRKQYGNYETTIKALREDRIPKHRKNIEDLKARIDAGT